MPKKKSTSAPSRARYKTENRFTFNKVRKLNKELKRVTKLSKRNPESKISKNIVFLTAKIKEYQNKK